MGEGSEQWHRPVSLLLGRLRAEAGEFMSSQPAWTAENKNEGLGAQLSQEAQVPASAPQTPRVAFSCSCMSLSLVPLGVCVHTHSHEPLAGLTRTDGSCTLPDFLQSWIISMTVHFILLWWKPAGLISQSCLISWVSAKPGEGFRPGWSTKVPCN